MAQTYKNSGPIYTTEAKYEAAKAAGTLEAGREYGIVDYSPLEKKRLIYDGETISLDGVAQTFENIKELVENESYYVFLTNGNYPFRPEYIDMTKNAIWFMASTTLNDIPYIYRITINSSNEITADEFPLQSQLTTADKQAIADLHQDKLPECPTTTNGTFILRATVSNGSVVYEWVSGDVIKINE